MAKKCEECGKGSYNANHVSNAGNKSKRKQKPNLQKWHGKKLCTNCIRSKAKDTN